MADFVQDFSATQSAAGTTILLTDLSNWAASGNNKALFIRRFTVTDADDVIIQIYELPVDSDTQIYPIAINQWQNIQFDIIGAFNLSKTKKYPFEQLYRLAYVKAIQKGCGCSCGLNDFCDVDSFYQGAQFAIPIGDGLSYDSNITSAYALIQS